ncbi:hypothetical protein M422DRAFT_37783 [Sphaerobolus stellatus SS14]|uniref:Uncharacterized protein n=1 Tax=Sphaerobolus stellatus (strain SS14) TaxID=990650 RepID=A0A0C9U0E8_SPHS4|nr:hypothetical protein M422DRAFT_37783 [Sphaerobolus stellatus SS14]
MSSGTTAQDKTWHNKEQGAEAQYIKEREKEQFAQLRSQSDAENKKTEENENKAIAKDKERDFEGGYGGQEDLEDRYATTSGEH